MYQLMCSSRGAHEKLMWVSEHGRGLAKALGDV